MEQLYKGHRIEVLAGLDGTCWEVSLRVFFQKGAARTLEMFAMNKQFETYAAAIEAGITAARNRIDTKIRAYPKTSQLRARSRQLCEQSKVLREALHSTVSKSRIIVEQSSALYLKIRSFHSFSELALSEGPARKS